MKLYETVSKLLYPITAFGIYLAIVNNDAMWLLMILPVNWFSHFIFSLNHRLISHRAFVPKYKWISDAIVLLNVLQISHSHLRFAIFHRHHHKYSDSNRDIHGPTKGFWRTTFTWEFHLEDEFKLQTVQIHKDLLRNQFLMWIDKNYFWILSAFLTIICLVSWKFFLFAYIPGVLLFKLTGSFFSNYYCHKYGYRNYDTQDTSSNSLLANFFTFGEGWHNNHHHNQTNPIYGEQWWEWDPTGFVIKHFLMRQDAV
jgi:stearoyl-CoA desaturase (delta-9 desaturase)